LCRTDREIPDGERRKLALFCNVARTAVIEARDRRQYYAVRRLITSRARSRSAGGVQPRAKRARIRELARHQRAHPHPEGNVTIAIVGKVYRHEGRL